MKFRAFYQMRVIIVILIMATAGVCIGADFYVTNTQDHIYCGPDFDDCTLRGAIFHANKRPDHDIIRVAFGTYPLTQYGPNEDNGLTGDLDIRGPLVIKGAGMRKTVINSDVYDRVFHVLAANATVRFEDLSIRGGWWRMGPPEDANGGGVLVSNARSVEFYRVRIFHNKGYNGGGIYFVNRKPESTYLKLVQSHVEQNIATNEGGGIYFKNNIGNMAFFLIHRSTINQNWAYIGGGLHLSYVSHGSINTSTIYKNGAALASEIFSLKSPLSIYHSTIVAHDGFGRPGHTSLWFAGFDPAGGKIEFYNSIIWGYCGPASAGDDFYKTPKYNMGDPLRSCGLGNFDIIIPTDPLLWPLGDYGGLTPTVLPKIGSTAIDPPWKLEACADGKDQRGVSRPYDGDKDGSADCDIGAVEWKPLALPPQNPQSNHP